MINWKLSKTISICALFLLGCGGSFDTDRDPVNQPTNSPPVVDNPEPTTDFINDFNTLLNQEIANFPEDKQKHVTGSKILFWVVDTEDMKSDFGIAMLAFTKTMRKGYDKEIGDVGNIEIDDITNAWDDIEAAIKVLDEHAKLFKLDAGDLQADLMGAGSSLIIYSDGYLND
jgi:hypothetical protein